MYVIRQNYITPDSPAMSFPRCTPFCDQNLCCAIARKNCAALLGTGRDEINRRIKPDPRESPQMIMHRVQCSGGRLARPVSTLADCNSPGQQPRLQQNTPRCTAVN